MKLRIEGNKIRFRLKRSEVEMLASGGRVDASVEFGPEAEDVLWYGIVRDDAIQEMDVRYAPGAIEVAVPAAAVQAWSESEQEGIRAEWGALVVDIEKDYACLHKPGESEDVFPRPEAATGS